MRTTFAAHPRHQDGVGAAAAAAAVGLLLRAAGVRGAPGFLPLRVVRGLASVDGYFDRLAQGQPQEAEATSRL